MPRYDYRCSQCDHGFELKQSFDSEPVATCPVCQGVARRRIHSVPVVFKGSGWYVNDYGKRGSAARNGTEPKESEAKAEGESKGESKPAGETASKTEPKSSADAKSETSETKVGPAAAKSKND